MRHGLMTLFLLAVPLAASAAQNELADITRQLLAQQPSATMEASRDDDTWHGAAVVPVQSSTSLQDWPTGTRAAEGARVNLLLCAVLIYSLMALIGGWHLWRRTNAGACCQTTCNE